MKKWVASYGLAQNDSSLSIVHGLLEVEGALVQSLPTEKDCSRVDNNRVPLLRQPGLPGAGATLAGCPAPRRDPRGYRPGAL